LLLNKKADRSLSLSYVDILPGQLTTLD